MKAWSLPTILQGLHEEIESRLTVARGALAHSGTKGDASEAIWLKLLQEYLPRRYSATSGHVVDSMGVFSEQIDVIVFDRQYTPLIFFFEGQTIVPAESVYGVFEAKQSINADQVTYAHQKAASVRRLHRTSLPIPFAAGTYPARQLSPIIAGLLALDSDWTPALGRSLADAVAAADAISYLDLGCIARHGIFCRAEGDIHIFKDGGKPATAFFFELVARLQGVATVPMIDIREYAKWLPA